MPRAASASAFLRMAAITGAESTGKLRGAAKEMYAERCAAGWNGVSAHAAAGRATMPCRGALADLHQPRPSSPRRRHLLHPRHRPPRRRLRPRRRRARRPHPRPPCHLRPRRLHRRHRAHHPHLHPHRHLRPRRLHRRHPHHHRPRRLHHRHRRHPLRHHHQTETWRR